MYEYIKGTLESIESNYVVVESNLIGYKIFVSPNAVAKLGGIGSEVKIYTYLNVKEDLMELYGFTTKEELFLYRMLITVSGVGPKAGISILSTMTPDSFKTALITGDAKTIAKAPGVGAKTAGRIILELKDKIKLDSEDILNQEIVAEVETNGDLSEAVEVLTVLGYSATEAKKAVSGLKGSVDEIVSQALKNMRNL